MATTRGWQLTTARFTVSGRKRFRSRRIRSSRSPDGCRAQRPPCASDLPIFRPLSERSPSARRFCAGQALVPLSSFAAHLAAYQGLFRELGSFKFLYIAAKDAYFRRAVERFRVVVKTHSNASVSWWSGRPDLNRGPPAPKARVETLSSWFV